MSYTELLCVPTTYASRMSRIPRSGIREILSSAGKESMISFGGGLPHDSCVPVDRIQTAFDNVISRHGARAFRYGASEGDPELRDYVASWLCRQGVDARSSQILIVNGSQQALDLLGKVFIDEGSPVAMERPTYLAALQAFSAYNPRYREVALDGEGPDLDDLRCALTPECRFFYAVPTFQNPSGVCYSKRRREVVADLVNQRGVVMIEDDPYSQLYYGAPPPPPLAAMGVKRSILLGTFSKMVAPGFRLGWIWTDETTLAHLVTAKQAADLCTGTFQQLLLLETLRIIDLEAHLAKVRAFYRRQRDAMAGFMERHLWGRLSWNVPEGGMFFWASLTGHGQTAQALLARCAKRGVAFGDGAAFHAGRGGREFLRLNFTQVTRDQMDQGLQIIAEQIEHRE